MFLSFLDDTILKVALTDIAPFLTGVTQPYNISTESMPNLNVPSTSYIIKNWTREAILQLINIRQKYDKEFRSTTMKTEKCWQLVVKDMEERGYVSTVNQCRDKWKYLKERYTKKKDNMSTRSSGAEFFKFDFFEEMDSFLGKNASITPVALAASMKRNMSKFCICNKFSTFYSIFFSDTCSLPC